MVANVAMIGQGTFIRGNVRGEGDLTVAGRIEGGVEIDGELLFEETATMKGDVTGRRIVVRCALLGNVSASESIALESGARVVGDLVAPHIGIEDGALVRGRVETGARDSAPRAQAATTRAAAPVATAAASAPARAARVPAPARPAPPRPAARRAPAPAIVVPASLRAGKAGKPTGSTVDHGPPAPVVPALKKKTIGTLKKRGAHR
jgi:cytoskeletal protein CcmA (bactofilin family)